MKLLKFILLFTISLNIFAQKDDDTQLALEYYRNKEYEKAADIYSKLFNQTKQKVFYNYLTYCYLELKNYDEAEKLVKKEIKRTPEDLSLYVDYGFILKSQNLSKDAVEQYETALKKISSDQIQIFNLANAFISKREYEFAEQTYIKGQKLLKNSYPFNLELANLYQIQRNYEKMIDEYLNLLLVSETYIQTVQYRLNNAIYSDSDSSLTITLKNSIIKKIQKHPDVRILNELLIWIYIQEKDFEKALLYSKSLDKRNKESGERILSLARLALSNEDYKTTIDAYKYIVNKGYSSEYYLIAKNEYLSALYQKIIKTNIYTKQEILELEKNYLETLSELGEKASTISLIKELSFIQSFYLSKHEAAINRLENALLIPGVKFNDLSEAKLVLADIYLFSNDIWSAAIYYAQVEKSNENAPIGFEAKFKKSKLAYYSGDFLWAQAQLDVLKASTSKLIANDAFYLSSVINDNITIDTNSVPLQQFSSAELLIYQNMDSLAIQKLDSIENQFPTHTLIDDILYLKYKISLKNQNFNQAKENLEKIVINHSYDILADDAMFKLAELFQFKFNDNEKAMDYYKNLLIKYPGSIYVVEARKRYRELRGDTFKVG